MTVEIKFKTWHYTLYFAAKCNRNRLFLCIFLYNIKSKKRRGFHGCIMVVQKQLKIYKQKCSRLYIYMN